MRPPCPLCPLDIQELVNQPRESLAVDLKSWIHPEEPAGIITLVKAAIAIRNLLQREQSYPLPLDGIEEQIGRNLKEKELIWIYEAKIVYEWQLKD